MRIIDKYVLAIVLLGIIMFVTFYNLGQLDRKSLYHTKKHLHSFQTINNKSNKNQIIRQTTSGNGNNDMHVPINIVKSSDGSVSAYKVPAFIILGVMKGGSTLLTSLLQNHPQIPGQSKELHFFDFNTQKANDIKNYHELFKKSKNIKFSKQQKTSELMALDSTPSYFTLTYIAPNIQKICPWVKLIVILRNPVDRLFSHYCHLRKTRESYREITFETFIQKDIDALQKLKLVSKNPTDDINLNMHNDAAWEEYINSKKINDVSQKNIHLQISVARGLYYMQLRQWFKYFPDNILVINFDELTSENGYQSVYNKAMDFLGLDYNLMKRKTGFSGLVQLKGKYDVVMNDDTKKMLYDLYAPYNRELKTLLGNEWNNVWEYRDNM